MPLEALDQNHLPPPKRLKTSTPIPPLDDADLEPENIEGDCVIDNVFPAEVEEPAAVEEYEEQKRRERGTYTSSIYVDAFNFALNTVAKGELYLFSGDEMEVFARYRSLDYEAQHLYVRLFLRKTNAWFRIDKLHYPKDIADVPAACATLVSKGVGFADSDEVIGLEDAAGVLSLDELKAVAKDAKCAGTNKAQMISGLRKASRQSGLQGSDGQLKLSFDARGNHVGREQHFVKRILKITGSCIRLSSAVTTLFNRVHLVFYRSTEWNEKSLTTVILSRTMKRTFPSYIVSRTSNIFPTRQALLDFEAAIKLQSEVDEMLANGRGEDGLKRVHEIFLDAFPQWKEMVLVEAENTRKSNYEEALERVYLRRFNAAWVYTRIIHKGVSVLGRFKEYKREHEVLSALLEQKFFQPARRGGWYQRRALVEENYLAPLDLDDPSASKEKLIKKWRNIALSTCEAGLQDPQTHLIFHHDLQKRILKLEHKLRVPKRHQHDFGHAQLRKPSERIMFGERTNTPEIGRKTLWRNPQGGPVCSVEEMCLAMYRREGWKGYHCEGGVVRTLFAYLFYDILFLYLPNVFETAFQICPLDLFTDGFYLARASEINHRLVEISNGPESAKKIVRAVWEENQERRTCVVGLDWSYEIRHLEEIVDCFPPEALSVVCKVLCQEYRQRGSGMPDLFLWRVGKRECMFSEVKSENDRLSDTQRLWIHVLTSAGMNVELCAARTKDKGGEKGKAEKRKKGARSTA